MIIVTRNCDRCKKDVPHDAQLLRIEVRSQFYQLSSYSASVVIAGDWCRDCAEAFGIVPKPDTPKEERKEPNLEDIVTAICHRVIDECCLE